MAGRSHSPSLQHKQKEWQPSLTSPAAPSLRCQPPHPLSDALAPVSGAVCLRAPALQEKQKEWQSSLTSPAACSLRCQPPHPLSDALAPVSGAVCLRAPALQEMQKEWQSSFTSPAACSLRCQPPHPHSDALALCIIRAMPPLAPGEQERLATGRFQRPPLSLRCSRQYHTGLAAASRSPFIFDTAAGGTL